MHVWGKHGYFPLTSSQEVIFFDQMLHPGVPLYNIGGYIRIEGPVSVSLLEKAINCVIRENDGLRIIFKKGEILPTQDFSAPSQYKLEFHDFSREKDPHQYSIGWLNREFVNPFELYGKRLCHFALIKASTHCYYWLIKYHHLIVDGWGISLITRRVASAYNSLIDGDNKEEDEPYSYIDYIENDHRYLHSSKYERDKNFWLNCYKDIPAPLIPRRYVSPFPKQTIPSGLSIMKVKWDFYCRLKDFARANNISMFHFFLGVFYCYFQSLSGESDFTVGFFNRNRTTAASKKTVGMFSKITPTRFNFGTGLSFVQLLKSLAGKLRHYYRHQRFPINKINTMSGLHETGRPQLFDLTLSFENFDFSCNLNGSRGEMVTLLNGWEQNALAVAVKEYYEYQDIRVDFVYNLGAFTDEEINCLKSRIAFLLQEILEHPDVSLSRLEIMPPEERCTILKEFNNTKRDYPAGKTIHQLFEEQAERTPDNIAVVGQRARGKAQSAEECQAPGARRQTITYKELNRQSHRLALLLRQKEVKPGCITAVMPERSLEMLIGLLAVLKAGGAYLPIDSDYPAERIKYMLADSVTKILLCQKTTGEQFAGLCERIDLGDEALYRCREVTLERLSTPEDFAYVTYTSGSTGRPKGVMIENRSVVNFIKGITDIVPFSEKDGILSLTTISFDIFGLETLLPLTRGSKVVIGSIEEQLDPLAAAAVLEREQITIFQVTPSRLQLFLSGGEAATSLEKLKYLLVGGEAFPAWLLAKVRQITNGKIYNVYGPTETTIWSTAKDLTGDNDINIGKPMANTRVYILSRSGTVQPLGVPGELSISGDGVARGYLNRPELTAEKFRRAVISHSSLVISSSKLFPNDQWPMTNDRLYRTGDLARWLVDGDIEFLGRIDSQVKIRGFRIELQEIENRLSKHPGIKEAVVVAFEGSGDKYLCAYIVSRAAGTFDSSPGMAEELSEYLAETLPGYMIPGYFIQIEKIPLTPNGKVNRKALPKSETAVKAGNYAAPGDKIEEKLLEIWSEVLGIEKDIISIDANFFRLGGHSLKATLLLSLLHKAFHVKVAFNQIFRTPSIRGLSGHIKGLVREHYTPIEPVSQKEYYCLSSAQKRVFILQQMEKDNTSYNVPAAFSIEGDIDGDRLERAFRAMIARHESLRTSFQLVREQPVQVIHDYRDISFGLEFYDLSKTNLLSTIDEAINHQIGDFIRPFDISQAPLLRARLLKITKEKHILGLDMHHIITDGISLKIFFKDLTAFYRAETLPHPPLQYKDFSEWQNREKVKGIIKKQEEYWLKEFFQEVPVLNLPGDYSRPSVQSFEGSHLTFELDAVESRGLKSLAEKEDVTMFMMLLAIYTVFLYKLTGQEDIVVGSPASGRRHADLQEIIGIFVNTLALRNFPASDQPFKVLLREIKDQTLAAFENQDFAFEELVEQVTQTRDPGRNPLFDTMLVWQDFEIPKLTMPGLKLLPFDFDSRMSKFDLTLQAAEKGPALLLDFEYCTKLFKKETIIRFFNYFKEVVFSVLTNAEIKLSEIEIVPEVEKKKILYEFNDTRRDYPAGKTINQLVEEQVAKTPDSVAVVGTPLKFGPTGQNDREQVQLTFRELNERANRLAFELKEKGVKPETMIGILVERSVEMVIGILGILKAGGAYVPILPGFPQNRTRYMLRDCGPAILVSHTGLLKKQLLTTEMIDICVSIKVGEKNNPVNTTLPGHLAYVIYTSGTSGKPKGVLVEHRNVANVISWFGRQYKLGPGSHILLMADYIFDPSVENIFAALIKGATVYITGKDIISNREQFLRYTLRHQVHLINLVPTLLKELLGGEEKIGSLSTIISGGESLENSLKDRIISKGYRLYNHYGPTEITVDALTHECSNGKVVLGKPLSNVSVYVCDKMNHLLPVGIPGELHIGGVGVARGYLNRPELTAEKFRRAVNSHSSLVISSVEKLSKVTNYRSSKLFPNDQCPMTNDRSSRLYQTGDLVKWLPDGNIEFLGRIDLQVKIRGFRIEPEEIKNLLLQYDDIKEAVVDAREDNPGETYLCAYIVPGSAIDTGEIRARLLGELPDYMIPAYFVPLAHLPLTTSGKIDRRALPAPTKLQLRQYETPRNNHEEKLALVWSEVLGFPGLGINENFFEVGGDSIKAIRVISRLHQYGLTFELKELFSYPRIKELAKCLKKIERRIDQAPVIGEIPLTPIQRWFFEKTNEDRHHFNQAVILYRREGFNRELLVRVFEKIVLHHDALRMVFKEEAGQVTAFNKGPGEKLFDFTYYDLTRMENPEVIIKIEKEAAKLQGRIDLKTGPLVKPALFKTDEGDHLLVIIHHLVVDGVSWRILLEDLENAYKQALKGEPATFPAKTDSYKYWAEQLLDYASRFQVLKELSYWKDLENQAVEPLPRDHPIEPGRQKQGLRETLTVILDKEQTEQLIKEIHYAYSTEINDILLTALGVALNRWRNVGKVSINLEGHGRESIIKGVNINRTVGWFTSCFPVILEINGSFTLPEQLKRVKETLRRIPNKGIGYGILRYLTPPDKKKGIVYCLKPEISFNYLGEFGKNHGKEDEFFTFSPIDIGSSMGPNIDNFFAIDINGIVIENRLRLTFSYNQYEYEKESMKELAALYRLTLEEIITHCLGKKEKELTPSDLGYSRMSFTELDQMLHLIGENLGKDKKVRQVYPLSPMQSGMLFHFLTDRESKAFFEQLGLSLKGNIDRWLLEKSFNLLVEKYAVLRTCFSSDLVSEPIQIVLNKRPLKLNYEDISRLAEEEKERHIQWFMEQDREKSFDLFLDPLLRANLIKKGESSYFLLIASHHIIMDGWSIPIIYKELARTYHTLKSGGQVRLSPALPFRKYIDWLNQQDKTSGLKYWESYLEGYDQVVGIPKTMGKRKEKTYKQSEVKFILGEGEAASLKNVASNSEVTLNTLFQAMWGVLLQKYNNTDDVVFGEVVSGRQMEIEGINHMIGLFINTVPIRITTTVTERFVQFLRQIQANVVLSGSYQYVSLADIQSVSELKSSVFDHIMVFENYPIDEEIRGQQVDSRGIDFFIDDIRLHEQTNYDFNIIILPGKVITVKLNYNALVYDYWIITNVVLHFKKIVRQVMADPDIGVGEFEILSEEEKEKLLVEFNGIGCDYPSCETIHELFEKQEEKTPHCAAVVGLTLEPGPGGNTRDQVQLTYKEINKKANSLSRFLRSKGVGTNDIVGLMLNKSIELVIGIIGVLKAGGAYLPFDPEYPEERKRNMLGDSSVKLLLTDKEISAGKRNYSFQAIEIINLMERQVYSGPGDNPVFCGNGTDLLYVVFTSGSTGRPKGVMLEHCSLVNLMNHQFRFTTIDLRRVLQFAAISFDVSLQEIFSTLLSGGTLYLVDNETRQDISLLFSVLEKNDIKTLFLPPSFLRVVFSRDELAKRFPRGITHIVTAGEQLVVSENLNYYLKENNVYLHNHYGPAETHVVTTLTLEPKGYIPELPCIGKPAANTRVYVLDKKGRVQPLGIAGELCISGNQVGRGYLNRPGLTAEKFRRAVNSHLSLVISSSKFSPNDQCPVTNDRFHKLSPNDRLYQTGDLARWLPDGNLEFLGRMDRQVKIRGYRIEPGEIENRLTNIPGIKECIVALKKDNKGENYLCAYFTSEETREDGSLRDRLARELPGYMIPSYFVLIDEVPLTPNRKIDWSALPNPGVSPAAARIAPRDGVEKKLAEAWAEVLGIAADDIGINDNFFQLGGHSLKATLLLSLLHKAFHVKVTLDQIFKTPFIRGQAGYIKGLAKEHYRPIEAVEQKEYYYLSSAQKRLFILQQMEKDSTGYNVPAAFSMEGVVNRRLLEKAFLALVGRHESLRTSFHMLEKEPVQRIHVSMEFEVEYHIPGRRAQSAERKEECHTPASKYPARDAMHHASAVKAFVRPFDLSTAPLMRVGWQKIGEQKHILMLDIHHIISDGISLGIFVRELMKLYGGEELTCLRLRYRDYTEWQYNRRGEEAILKQGSYWLKVFQSTEEIPLLDLPADYIRPAVQSFVGSVVYFEIDEEQTGALKRMALEEGISLFMLLLALYNIFLAKLSSQEDIVMGTPVAGRKHSDLQEIIGVFVNTLALRNYPSAGKRFKDFLAEVKENTLQALENQEYQFEELVDQVVVNRNVGRNPLFDVMFIFQNIEVRKLEIPGLKLKPYDSNYDISRFDMTLTGMEEEKKLVFSIEYCKKLFKKETVKRFIIYFKEIVSSVIPHPGKKIGEIEILSKKEKQRIIFDFNNTVSEYPGDKTLHQLFEEQVESTPDNIAVVGQRAKGKGQSAEERHVPCAMRHAITYGELNKKCNQLAVLLRQKGIKPGSIAAVMPERSPGMLIGILAILKAGGAYLPVDPDYPPERIKYMLADSVTKILLCQKTTGKQFAVLCEGIDLEDESCCRWGEENIERLSTPADLAYVTYTSGSTGNPKGVMIENRAVVNFIKGITDIVPFSERDRILSLTTISFDIFGLETLLPLTRGSKVVIGSNEEQMDPWAATTVLEREQITIFQVTPSRLQLFLSMDESVTSLEKLKYLLVGGEAFPAVLLAKVRQIINGKIYNVYGPTETTIWSTAKDLTGEKALNIGKPLANTRVYILSGSGAVQPLGVPGELSISGDGVARGYLNGPELTAEKFRRAVIIHSSLVISSSKLFPNDQWPMTNDRLYRTGDLARWLADGDIEFLGRIDSQVKIRGFRIELQEIENQLSKHPGIKEAVVVASGESTDEYLCAYIVPLTAGAFDSLPAMAEELDEYLAETLPGYMIPGYFKQIEEIPLTPNGKVNRKVLSPPGIGTDPRYVAPGDEIEEKLVEIWSEVLGIEKDIISINANFFRLGGHSLKATITLNRIHKTLDVIVPLIELFKTPTIKGLAYYIRRSGEDKFVSIAAAEKKDYYVLSSAQKRLYILQQIDLESTGYNIPAAVELEGVIEKNKLENTFRRLIPRHESLRTSFHMLEKEPVQRIHDSVEFEVEYHIAGCRVQSAERKEEHHTPANMYWASSAMHHASAVNAFVRPFDLSKAPLMRVGLIKIGKQEHLLMLDMHHIISDGISLGIFVGEYMKLYNAEELEELKLRYKDYSEWQNSEKERERIKKQEGYWLKEFEGEIPVLSMPFDYSRPVSNRFKGRSVSFSISEEDTEALNTLALKEQTTLFMVLISVYYVLLFKLSGQEDIVIGSPTAGRMHTDLENIIGAFINMLALRSFPREGKTFNKFLKEVKAKVVAAFENQEYPFEKLVDESKVKRDTGRHPLFDVILVLQNQEVPEMEIPGLKLRHFEYETSKFDLGLYGEETDRQLFFNVNYSTALFKQATVEILTEYYKNIVSSVLKNPAVKLSEIEVMSKDKRAAILSELNKQLENEAAGIMADSIFQAKLNESLCKFKDNTAIEYGEQAMSYSELNSRSNYIANWIVNRGSEKETSIGILINNRADLITAIIGIINACCVFVPLSPVHPEDRLEIMIKNTDIKLIISDQDNFNRLAGVIDKQPVEFVLINDLFSNDKPLWFTKRPNIHYSAEDRIYIYFSSGSTGKPHAILGKNMSLLHFINWEIDNFAIKENFRVSQFINPTFDAFLRDIFVPLCSGGTICIPGYEEIVLNPDKLIDWIDRAAINLIHCVPGLFRLLNSGTLRKDHFQGLRLVSLSGEKIYPSDLGKWYEIIGERIQLLNFYGPTEVTMIKTYYMIQKSDLVRSIIPVGKPMIGSRVIIMKENMNICGELEVGELYIRTPFGTYGYANEPELNWKRFVPTPFANDTRDILFKTGDLGRLLPGGNIEVTGRMDRQVKIRGIRIELEEIECVLMKHPCVKEAVVIKKELSDNNEFLCAYVIENGKNDMADESLIANLRDYLSKKLPAYMVPANILKIEEIPRNPNGKVDNEKLLHSIITRKTTYIPPGNDLEKRLLKIWSGVLEIEDTKISVTRDFFELGGNSLNIISLVSQIRREFDVKISVQEVFRTPIIKRQAKLIRGAVKDKYATIEALEKKEHYALSSTQKRMYILQQMDPESVVYNLPRIIPLGEKTKIEKFEEIFIKLIKRHESFRTSFELVDEEPVQRVHDEVAFEIEYYQSQETGTQPAASIIRCFIRPFNLAQAPLLRVGLVRTEEEKYFLLVDMHHIISDGFSQIILIQDFSSLYLGEELPELKLQYKDYSEWQNRNYKERAKWLMQQEKYWLKQFEREIPKLKMPGDYARTPRLNLEGGATRIELDTRLTGNIKKLISDTGTTLYIFLLASFYVLLSKYTGQEDIVVASGIAGRTHADMEKIVGMFVNILAMRNRPKANQPFDQLLEEVKENTFNAFNNQDYQFDELVMKLEIPREYGRNPFFEAGLTLQNFKIPEARPPELKLISLDYDKKTSEFDLHFSVTENDNSISLILEYSTALYKRTTAEDITKHYVDVLAQVTENRYIKLKDITLSHSLSSTKSYYCQEEYNDFNF